MFLKDSEKYTKQKDNESMQWENIVIVTNYDLLGRAAIIRKSVHGHFKLLCPVFAESNLKCILIMIITFPTEFISY